MKRLTQPGVDYCVEVCGLECAYSEGEIDTRCVDAQIYRKLAAYEDTGLEPEEVKAAKAIAERIATADYPHNFQRERSDIAVYMRWITDVMRDAKAWWNSRILTREEGGTDG